MHFILQRITHWSQNKSVRVSFRLRVDANVDACGLNSWKGGKKHQYTHHSTANHSLKTKNDVRVDPRLRGCGRVLTHESEILKIDRRVPIYTSIDCKLDNKGRIKVFKSIRG